MAQDLVADDFRSWSAPNRTTGVCICGSPFEMKIILDYTGPRGSGSNLYLSYVYQLPKWDYTVKKVDEFMEVTPEWAEFYSLTIGQKQKLMESIKSGLMSAAEAVSGYELLAHDSRRYKEIIDYFKAGKKDEHVLRSLFVDRVDAFTGEGYSMISMTKRWPTIISDFIRMKTEWTDPEKISEPSEQLNRIKKELDVSHAEATVLKTKNELFREWQKTVLPAIKERYARIENLARARKKSIDEYKSWLKPYLARHKMMKESLEVKPSGDFFNAYITPGFGQSQALTGIRLWAWKHMVPGEFRKTELGPGEEIPYYLKDPETGKMKKKTMNFIIDPYDGLVKKWCRKISEKYDVGIYEDDAEIERLKAQGKTIKTPYVLVRKVIQDAITPEYASSVTEMHTKALYYVFFDVLVLLSLVKTPPPEALETDNVMIWPLRGWFMSQNALLIHLIELAVRGLKFDSYVDEMIGAKSIEEKILQEIDEELEGKKEIKPSSLSRFFHRFREWKGGVLEYGSPLDRLIHVFVKRGPYETLFYERVSKLMARGMGGYYGQQVNFLKEKMGVGKF